MWDQTRVCACELRIAKLVTCYAARFSQAMDWSCDQAHPRGCNMQVKTALRYSQQLTNLSTLFPLATKAAGGPHREAAFPLLIWTMYARWEDILAAPQPGALSALPNLACMDCLPAEDTELHPWALHVLSKLAFKSANVNSVICFAEHRLIPVFVLCHGNDK